MSGTHLRVIAEEYASQGLSTIVLSPQSKSPLMRWKSYQYEPPSTFERDAMFSFGDKLNIGVVCGAASENLAVIDAETTLALETQLRRCEQAGVADTWIDETSRAGHILTRLPTAVKPKSFKSQGFEVRGQGQYVLVPPSIHPRGTLYRFLLQSLKFLPLTSWTGCTWSLRLRNSYHEQQDTSSKARDSLNMIRAPKRSKRSLPRSSTLVSASMKCSPFSKGILPPESLERFRH